MLNGILNFGFCIWIGVVTRLRFLEDSWIYKDYLVNERNLKIKLLSKKTIKIRSSIQDILKNEYFLKNLVM